MMKTNPLDLGTGYELNAWIEHFIFGRSCQLPDFLVNEVTGKPADPRPFSSDADIAKLIVWELNGRVESGIDRNGAWAKFQEAPFTGRGLESRGETEAHAICLAAVRHHLEHPDGQLRAPSEATSKAVGPADAI
jgi:hypothetical protein